MVSNIKAILSLKTIISLLLTVVLFTGGYSVTRQALTGGESTGLRDNTGYAPVSFSWSGMENRGSENSRFLAGKYVRNDGNAVLYIDYQHGDGDLYFFFELYVMETRSQNELRVDGMAHIIDDGVAFYVDQPTSEYLAFENIREGVIEVEADLFDTLAPADGTYYIDRAKYVETPKTIVINDTSRNRGGGGISGHPDTQDGGTQGPGGTQDGNTPGPGGSLSGSSDFMSVTPYIPNDPVGEIAEIRGDGPDKTDEDIIPKTPEAHDDFEKINEVRKTPFDNTGVAQYLNGKHIRMTGTSTIRWDYVLDRGTFMSFYREQTDYSQSAITALMDFKQRGGYIGDIQETTAEFVFGDNLLVKYNMKDGPYHQYNGYTMYQTNFDVGARPVAIRNIIWNTLEGYFSATLYQSNKYEDDMKTVSVSLRFGRDTDGTVIAHGWGIYTDRGTMRTIVEIDLRGEELDWSKYEGVWVSEPLTSGNHVYPTQLMEIRNGHMVRRETNGVAQKTGSLDIVEHMFGGDGLAITFDDGSGAYQMGQIKSLSGDVWELGVRTYRRQSP